MNANLPSLALEIVSRCSSTNLPPRPRDAQLQAADSVGGGTGAAAGGQVQIVSEDTRMSALFAAVLGARNLRRAASVQLELSWSSKSQQRQRQASIACWLGEERHPDVHGNTHGNLGDVEACVHEHIFRAHLRARMA